MKRPCQEVVIWSRFNSELKFSLAKPICLLTCCKARNLIGIDCNWVHVFSVFAFWIHQHLPFISLNLENCTSVSLQIFGANQEFQIMKLLSWNYCRKPFAGLSMYWPNSISSITWFQSSMYQKWSSSSVVSIEVFEDFQEFSAWLEPYPEVPVGVAWSLLHENFSPRFFRASPRQNRLDLKDFTIFIFSMRFQEPSK